MAIEAVSIRQTEEENLVRIYQSGTDNFVSGTLMEDITLGVQANWSSGSAVTDVIDGVGNLARTLGGANYDSMKSFVNSTRVNQPAAARWASTYQWAGTDRPTFNVSIGAFCLKDTDDVRAQLAPLFDYTLPQVIGGDGGVIIPPLGYRTSLNGAQVEGVLRLGIGQWFSAGGLVCSGVQTVFSKVLNKKGKPLFGIANVTLQPAQEISADTFRQYLRQ